MATKIDYEIGIIGAGFGGLGAAIRLKEAGHQDFVIFERAGEVGGTWRDNIYPGCACDIPSHLYSYSFALNPNWSREYSKQPEILDYILKCKEHYKLEPHLRYNTRIVQSIFKEGDNCWELTSEAGVSTRVRVLISAIGPLNVPSIPTIKGAETFEGKSFHSSEWDASIDLKGKRVAVVGTGASAIQIVPTIAAEVKDLYLFQRTAAWILPKNDGVISSITKKVFSSLPLVQRAKRSAYYWFYEFAGTALYRDNFVRTATRRIAKKHLEKSIKDPVLRKKLTPNYEIGCKRRLPSDDFYPALTRLNVELITKDIQEIRPQGILEKDGKLREVDMIIYATGFHVADFTKRDVTVLGKGGRNLFEDWSEKGPEGYYGTCVSGFPNLLLILGPNTGLGHNSQLHIIESQITFVLDYIETLKSLPADACLDVKASAQQEFNESIHENLKGMVWSSGGCNSWYIHESGRNSTLWPGSTATYRKCTKQIVKNDFLM